LRSFASIIYLLMIIGIVTVVMLSERRVNRTIIIPQNNLAEYHEVLKSLNQKITGKGYISEDETLELRCFLKRKKVNLIIAVLLFLISPIPFGLCLSLWFFGYISSGLDLAGLVSMFLLALAVVYVIIAGKERTISIRMASVERGYSITIDATGWMHLMLRPIVLQHR